MPVIDPGPDGIGRYEFYLNDADGDSLQLVSYALVLADGAPPDDPYPGWMNVVVTDENAPGDGSTELVCELAVNAYNAPAGAYEVEVEGSDGKAQPTRETIPFDVAPAA